MDMATKDQSCESECKEIHESLGKLNHLAQLLAYKNQLERRQIKETYMDMYGEDLINCVRNKANDAAVSPNLCSSLSMWMLDPIERDAVMVREALDGDGDGDHHHHHLQSGEIHYKALVEIFVGRKSSHIVMIKQVYFEKFRRHLDQDIRCIEPPHPHQKILMALAASHKAHHADVSQHIAKCDARRLYQTGEGSSGAINEAVVLEIFSKRSIPQLKLTFSSYKCIYGHNYTKSLKNENFGEFEDSLRVVVKCIYNPSKYHAKALYESLIGKTRDRCDVGGVMMRRAEVDMNEIRNIFKKKYGMELRDAIHGSIPAGDFRDFLIALATESTTLASIL